MKAAIVESPGNLVVREIAEPNLGDYDARCTMLYGAVCTGTDKHLVHNQFPWPVTYPTILGHEAIGRVTAVGPKVRTLKVGDLVTRVGAPGQPENGLHANWGGFAEVGIAKDHWAMREDGVPEGEWQPYLVNQVLPPDTDPVAATMVITWRETLSYITRMGVGEGARVLVLGTGGNGLAFVAHAANAGAAEVAVIGSAVREETAKAVGATHFYDYKTPDYAAIAEAHPAGFDFIIDAVGKSGQMSEALPLLRAGGTIGLYGLDDFGALAVDVMRARGSFTFYNGGYSEAETHERVVELMRAGKLDARHWINVDNPYDFEEIHEAFAALERRELVKAVLRISAE